MKSENLVSVLVVPNELSRRWIKLITMSRTMHGGEGLDFSYLYFSDLRNASEGAYRQCLCHPIYCEALHSELACVIYLNRISC